jgi:hypothetical protein
VAQQAVHPGQGITIVVFTTLPRMSFMCWQNRKKPPVNQGLSVSVAVRAGQNCPFAFAARSDTFVGATDKTGLPVATGCKHDGSGN